VTKAIRIYRHGGPEVLRWEDVEVGAPGPGQIRLRNTAVGVNFREIYVRTGLHEGKLPSGLGFESAGVVEAVGSGVTDIRVGQRVGCAAGPEGAYAEVRVVAADRAVPLPDAIDDRTAAAILLKGLTARYLIRETYPVKAGDTILVHAAAGGVGQIMCQWAKHLGATVIGTVGSRDKADVARRFGCDHAIVYTQEDFAARVREITGGRGCAAVYDSVGKATFEGSLRCVRPRGVLASFGEASGDPEPIAPRRLGPLGSIYLTHPSLNWYVPTRETLLASAGELFDMVAGGKVRIAIDHIFSLKDAADAHRLLESRRTVGPIVLIP
jgi:NADPH2:quinone reductase